RCGAGGALHLALDTGSLGRLADIARRAGEFGADVEAAAVEVLGRLGIELHGRGATLGNADELQEAGPVRGPILPEARYLVPNAVHGGASGLIAEIGQIGIDVILGGTPLPGLDRAATGNPHGRMRRLDRTRPDIDVALLIEATVEGEGFAFGP